MVSICENKFQEEPTNDPFELPSSWTYILENVCQVSADHSIYLDDEAPRSASQISATSLRVNPKP